MTTGPRNARDRAVAARDELRAAGKDPSLREIGERIGQSPARVHRLLALADGREPLVGVPPTMRQVAFLQFIADFTAARGYPPTVREIAARFGNVSTNSAQAVLVALERRKLLTREKLRSRTLRVTDEGTLYLDIREQEGGDHERREDRGKEPRD